MREYQIKINLLQEKITKLKEQETQLVKKRKELIGQLAEQNDLLIFSDACLAGIFGHCKEVLLAHPSQVKQYEEKGKDYLNQKRRRQVLTSDSSTPPTCNSLEATHD
jgi:hypothetical protein